MSEAVAYLTQLDVTEGKQALPADMHTGRKDALRKIQSLMAGVGAARDVVRLFCHPGGKSMHMTLDEKEIYDALYQLYCAADDSLLAAYRALDAGIQNRQTVRTRIGGQAMNTPITEFQRRVLLALIDAEAARVSGTAREGRAMKHRLFALFRERYGLQIYPAPAQEIQRSGAHAA